MSALSRLLLLRGKTNSILNTPCLLTNLKQWKHVGGYGSSSETIIIIYTYYFTHYPTHSLMGHKVNHLMLGSV